MNGKKIGRLSALSFLFCLFFIIAACSTEQRRSQLDASDNAGLWQQKSFPVNRNRRDFMSLTQAEKPGSYRYMHEIYPSRRIEKGRGVSTLERREEPLDISYRFRGKTYSLDEFMRRNDTTGFLVLKNGRIAYEGYFLGATEQSLFTSFSVGKSIVSTLVGLAIGEGKIGSVDDKLVDYMPQYANSGFKDVTIKQALQMSSGANFIEDYSLDGSHFGTLMVEGLMDQTKSFSEIMTQVGPKVPPGSLFNYSSGESTVLSELVATVTGKSASQYLSEKIWSKIGMESDAFWVTDKDSMEFGAGSLSITLRDYARFGQLMLDDGKFSGQQILPAGWVAEATSPDSPQVQPGQLYEGYPMGYQYQWWTLPGGKLHPYSAVGVYGQYVYINPAEDIVIVKTSVWQQAEDEKKEEETFVVFEAIEAALHHSQ